jgi:hypothetical protein
MKCPKSNSPGFELLLGHYFWGSEKFSKVCFMVYLDQIKNCEPPGWGKVDSQESLKLSSEREGADFHAEIIPPEAEATVSRSVFHEEHR